MWGVTLRPGVGGLGSTPILPGSRAGAVRRFRAMRGPVWCVTNQGMLSFPLSVSLSMRDWRSKHHISLPTPHPGGYSEPCPRVTRGGNEY